MKIGYLVADSEIPLLGNEGCSIHIREFTNALVDAGHDVFVVCSWLGEGATEAPRARIHRLGPRGLDATAWRLLEEEPGIRDNDLERDLRSIFANLWLEAEAGAILERERPDVLYERFSLFGWAGAELARRRKIPLIVEVNTNLRLEQDGYEKFRLTRTAEAMERGVLELADAVVAVSEPLRDWVVSLGVDSRKVHVVPNAVPDRLYAAEPSANGARERLGLDGHPVIGFVGSFQPWHDVRGLLRAFQRLHREDPDLRLVLVGHGDGREEAEEAADELGVRSATVFTGNVPHEQVPELIAAMDVVAAPYRVDEGLGFLPIKLFEYMGAGRPTVAAAVGQIGDFVEHGRTGWLYRPGDDDDLAAGLSTLVYDRERASAIGRAAREKVLAEHTWSSAAARIVDLAESL